MSIVLIPICNMSSTTEIEFYDAEIYIVFFFGMPITMCLYLGVQFIYVDQVFPFWLVLYIYCYFLGSTTFTLAVKNQYNTPLTRAIFNGNVDV